MISVPRLLAFRFLSKIRKFLWRNHQLSEDDVAKLVEESRLHEHVIQKWHEEFLELFPRGVASREEFCNTVTKLLQCDLSSDPRPLLNRIFTYIVRMPEVMPSPRPTKRSRGREAKLRGRAVTEDSDTELFDSVFFTKNVSSRDSDSNKYVSSRTVTGSLLADACCCERGGSPLSRATTTTTTTTMPIDANTDESEVTFPQLVCFLAMPLVGYTDKKLEWAFDVLAYHHAFIHWEEFKKTLIMIRKMRGAELKDAEDGIRQAFDKMAEGRGVIDKARFR
ncbi:uncharacterized protein LOC111267771 isoform X2 [Varroa jacobsoni]|nr:uncharacterized protein LOC111267771 isoform X2 [Varroa jacobsoni]